MLVDSGYTLLQWDNLLLGKRNKLFIRKYQLGISSLIREDANGKNRGGKINRKTHKEECYGGLNENVPDLDL